MYFDIEDQIENNFIEIDALLHFTKGGKILIATDSISRSTTWHDLLTNSRGKKLEDYLASIQLHIINEESERFTYHNIRGSSNIDLTITNKNLIVAVNDWEISAEESYSDHNFFKYNTGLANSFNNVHNYQGT